MNKLKRAFIFSLLTLISTHTMALTPLSFQSMTQVRLTFPEKEESIPALTKELCRSENPGFSQIREINRVIESILPSENDIEAFSNCLVSLTSYRVKSGMDLHFGINFSPTNHGFNDALKNSFTSEQLEDAASILKRALRKYTNPKTHLSFHIDDVKGSLYPFALNNLHVAIYDPHTLDLLHTWIDSDLIYDSSFTERKLENIHNYFDFQKLRFELFAAYSNEVLGNSARIQEFKYNLRADEVLDVKVILNRVPNSPEGRWHLGTFKNGQEIVGIYYNNEIITKGYIGEEHLTEYNNRDNLTLEGEWHTYNLGASKKHNYPLVADSTAPKNSDEKYFSQFLSSNMLPMKYITSEIDVSYGMSITIKTNGHNFNIVRYGRTPEEVKDYYTLEGIPCRQLDKMGNELSCKLPLKARNHTREDDTNYLFDWLIFNKYENSKKKDGPTKSDEEKVEMVKKELKKLIKSK